MRNTILCGALTALAIMGCQRQEQLPTAAAAGYNTEQVITEVATTRPILARAMLTADVTAGRSKLEFEGYRYVDTNSLVMILNTFEGNEALPTPSTNRPSGKQSGGRLKRADTMVWLAFDNPTSDSGNHAALLWGGEAGDRITRLIELDVSSGIPQLIRHGRIIDSQYQPGDSHELDGWFACLAVGLFNAAWRCSWTNCGWAHCAAINGGGALVVCTAAKLFGYL